MVIRSSTALSTMMRAVSVCSFGGPEVCKVSQTTKPTAKANQVLIKMKYAGINPVDTYIRSGTYARKPQLPYTPGSDGSGIVEAVGEDVTQFKPGDPVFTVRTLTGTCAEYTVAETDFTYNLNTDKLTFQQGACLGVPYFTAYRALVSRGKSKPGETVLIHGASGGVGTICVQMAKNLGLRVLATAGSDTGLSIVKGIGADATYNHRTPGYIQKIMNDTEGKGVDIVVEMLANVNLQSDLELLSTNGRVVVVGNRGDIQINPRLMMAKESMVLGCMLGLATPQDWQEMREAVAAAQSDSWLSPAVSPVGYTLDSVPQAHEDIISNTGAAGNLVIRLEEE